MTTLVKQWQLFLLAVSFFTRIPVRFSTEITASMLHRASRYFALVGLLIGIICATTFVSASLVFNNSIAILLTMAVNLLLTGAFHEDGWADVWDGFGGGWKVTDKLNIMKDSRLGTYGAAALFVMLMLKYQALTLISNASSAMPSVDKVTPETLSNSLPSSLSNISLDKLFTTTATATTSELPSPNFWEQYISEPMLLTIIAIVLAQTLSRVVATSLILSMSYVSEDMQSKVKPLAQHLSFNSAVVLITTGIFLALAITLMTGFTLLHMVNLLIVLIIVRQGCIFWFNRQLGGYTGDCLGAAQQLSEVVTYLYFAALVGKIS